MVVDTAPQVVGGDVGEDVEEDDVKYGFAYSTQPIYRKYRRSMEMYAVHIGLDIQAEGILTTGQIVTLISSHS